MICLLVSGSELGLEDCGRENLQLCETYAASMGARPWFEEAVNSVFVHTKQKKPACRTASLWHRDSSCAKTKKRALDPKRAVCLVHTYYLNPPEAGLVQRSTATNLGYFLVGDGRLVQPPSQPGSRHQSSDVIRLLAQQPNRWRSAVRWVGAGGVKCNHRHLPKAGRPCRDGTALERTHVTRPEFLSLT